MKFLVWTLQFISVAASGGWCLYTGHMYVAFLFACLLVAGVGTP